MTQTTTSTTQEYKTALDYFDDMHDDRIGKADQVPIDLSVFEQHKGSSADDEACDHIMENFRENNQPQTDTNTKGSLIPPIIDFEHLNELYCSECVEDHHAAERHQLFQLVKSRGGCCLVRFQPDSKYASVLKNMWTGMEEFFQQVDTDNFGTPNDKIINPKADAAEDLLQDPELKRQHLTRPEQAPDAGGYDFVQTYWDPETKKVVPTTIQDSLGCDHPCSNAIEDSFHAILEISKMFTIVLSSGGLQRPIQQMESLLNTAILDDFGCCNHRLCQYRPLMVDDPRMMVDHDDTADDDAAVESLLRSHTDWSLVTCIPVSPTPGLLIFDPLHQKWLAPDTVTSRGVRSETRTGDDEQEESHSQYCLIMTGKSMDMLLGVQGGMACIHQVVPTFRKDQNSTKRRQADKTRLSAPFFLRPKESVSMKINDECNEKPCPSLQEGISKLHEVYCELSTTTTSTER